VNFLLFLSRIGTLARWEVKRAFGVMGKGMLPMAVVLFVLLVAATGFAAERGLHLQDGIYRLGVDDRVVGEIFSGDERFTITIGDGRDLFRERAAYDIIVIGGQVYVHDT